MSHPDPLVAMQADDPSWRPLAERACAVWRSEVAAEPAGAAVPRRVRATFEAMPGEAEAAGRHADRAVAVRVAGGDAVLAGASLIRGGCGPTRRLRGGARGWRRAAADRAAGAQGRRVKTAPWQTTLFSSRSSMVPRELARISGVLVAWRTAKT